MRIPLLFLLCLITSLLHSQNEQKIDSLEQLIKHTKIHDTLKIKAYNDLGILYAYSNPDLAKEYINNALHLATQIERPRGIAGAYNCLGIVDYYQKDYDAALINFQKALEVNVALEHLWGQAAALNQIGAVQNLKDDYAAAIDNFQKAGDLFIIMKDSLAWAKSLQNIGLSYSRMAHHKKAIENYLKAIQLYKTSNNPEGAARVYVSIANIFYKQENYIKSLEYLQEALTLEKTSDNLTLLSVISRKMGSCYSQLEDYDKALNYFQEAIAYKKKRDKNSEKSIRYIQFDIGNTYYKMKEYNEALSYQKEALEKYGLNSLSTVRARIHNAIAKTYVALNQLNVATNYATNALKISKSVGDLKEQKEAYYTLAMLAKQQGENEKALQFYIDYQKFSDSLSYQEKQQHVRELTTIYETEKRDNEIDKQKTNITLLNVQNKNKKQLLLFGSIGFITIFGGILLVLSMRNTKKRAVVQKEFSKNLIQAQEIERNRISKELHDSVGQQLTLIKKKAQNLEQSELSSLTNTALEEVRSISRNLYPATLKQLGLTESINQLLLRLDEETDMFFSVEIDEIGEELNEVATLNLYRFIQEAVHNVLKHADAKTLIVNVVKKKSHIEVFIKDNGIGFNTNKAIRNNSLGLKTMAERMSILKGALTLKSKVKEGTTIRAQIPI